MKYKDIITGAFRVSIKRIIWRTTDGYGFTSSKNTLGTKWYEKAPEDALSTCHIVNYFSLTSSNNEEKSNLRLLNGGTDTWV